MRDGILRPLILRESVYLYFYVVLAISVASHHQDSRGLKYTLIISVALCHFRDVALKSSSKLFKSLSCYTNTNNDHYHLSEIYSLRNGEFRDLLAIFDGNVLKPEIPHSQ